MTNKRILTLISLLLFLFLVAGCMLPPINHAPIITSAPITTATVGVAYTYDVNATDPDEDTLIYSLTVKPDGMAIKSTTGVINWLPSFAQVGDNAVTVVVSDGDLSVIQSFTIKVSKLTPTPIPTKYYTITATAEDGGSINPSGAVKVKKGSNISFTITPDSVFYGIETVSVDGISVGVVPFDTFTYDFNNVTEAHTIHATFEFRDRVYNQTKKTHHNTIQDAIDEADEPVKGPTGDTILVMAGIYSEDITINRGITLLGPNTGINAATGSRVDEAVIDAGESNNAVTILNNLGEVTVDGFTVQGFTQQGIMHRFTHREGTTAHVLNNIVLAPNVAEAHGNSIQVSGDESTVIGNECTGAELESEFWTGTAILVVAGDNITVRDNYVHNAELGIGVAGYGSWGGPAVGTLIANNTVIDSEYGIDIQLDSQDTVITGNAVENNNYGIRETACWGDVPSGTQVHFNNIAGNENYGVSVVSEDGTDITEHSLDATNNWWGDASGPRGGALDPCENVIAAGTGDGVSSNVCFYPWLLKESF